MFSIHYRLRASMEWDDWKEANTALLQRFAERGAVPGTVAHYSYLDGGGIVIVDGVDHETIYREVLSYSPWFEFEVRPMLPVEQGVGIMGSVLQG